MQYFSITLLFTSVILRRISKYTVRAKSNMSQLDLNYFELFRVQVHTIKIQRL